MPSAPHHGVGGVPPRPSHLRPRALLLTSTRAYPDKSAAGLEAFLEESPRGEAARGAGTASLRPRSQPRPLSALPLPGKKCTYGIKCKYYHPERPPHAQLAVADELRAQTRAWRGAGADEERPRGARAVVRAEQGAPRGAPAAAWPGPREPGTRSLPGARRAADVAALEGGFSRLAFRDDTGPRGPPPPGPGCALALGPRGPDWVAPGASRSPPALPGLLTPPSASGPQVALRGGVGPGDPQGDLLPQRRQPADPWALPQGTGRFPGRSAWAESRWGDSAFVGPSGSTPRAAAGDMDARARTRTALCSIFPPQEVDRVMALFPALSDVTKLILLIQRLQRSGAPVGNPSGASPSHRK